ncbi:hypothetical protein ABPG72_001323 [Tetrahymena utriculariae]
MNFKTLQKLVEFSTILLLLLGIFWVIFASIIYSKNKDISNVSEYNSYRGALALGIAFGIVLIIWALIGLLAACKKYNCLLGTYNVGVFILLLISLAILVISIVMTDYIQDYKNDTNCTQKSLLKDLKKLNYQSYQMLCQISCKCNYTGQNPLLHNIFNYSSSSGVVRAQDCQEFSNIDISDLNSYSDLLRSVEDTFSCSGFCSKNQYYVFSNVNNGFPNKDCKTEVIDFIDTNNTRIIIASAIITFFFLMSFILVICLCCKKPKGENFYQRTGEGQYNAK